MLTRLEDKIFKLSDKTFYFLLVFLIIIKNGIHPIGSDWISWVYRAGNSFPKPINYLSYSFGPIFISKIFSFPSFLVWWLIFAVFTILFYVGIYFMIKILSKNNFKKYAIVFFAFTFSVSPLYYVGHYDLFTIGAGILAATTRNKSLIIIAALIAVSANPEQAMMTSLCVLIFALGSKNLMDEFIAKSWLLISIISYLGIRLFIGQGNDGSRFKIIINQMKDIGLDSLGKINFIVFSVFGVGWIVIFLGSSYIMKIAKIKYLLLGSVVLPLLFSILILDRTRVGVAIGTLPILLLLKLIAREVKVQEIPDKFFIYLLLTVLITPQIFIDFDGALRLPYAEFIKHFVV
jgi:hypothetical protein